MKDFSSLPSGMYEPVGMVSRRGRKEEAKERAESLDLPVSQISIYLSVDGEVDIKSLVVAANLLRANRAL